MAEWLVKLWREMRGSAAWDAVKLLWAAGGAFVSTVVHAAVGLARGHPNILSLAITGGIAIFFIIVSLIVYRNPGQKAAGPEKNYPDSTVTAHSQPSPDHVAEVPRDAPSLLLQDVRDGNERDLLLSNETGKAALIRLIHPIHCKEIFEADYDLSVTPAKPQVTADAPVRCRILGISGAPSQTVRVENILRDCAREGSASLVIDYADTSGSEYSRLFHLVRNHDD